MDGDGSVGMVTEVVTVSCGGCCLDGWMDKIDGGSVCVLGGRGYGTRPWWMAVPDSVCCYGTETHGSFDFGERIFVWMGGSRARGRLALHCSRTASVQSITDLHSRSKTFRMALLLH
jgi:hypothetical protein